MISVRCQFVNFLCAVQTSLYVPFDFLVCCTLYHHNYRLIILPYLLDTCKVALRCVLSSPRESSKASNTRQMAKAITSDFKLQIDFAFGFSTLQQTFSKEALETRENAENRVNKQTKDRLAGRALYRDSTRHLRNLYDLSCKASTRVTSEL